MITISFFSTAKTLLSDFNSAACDGVSETLVVPSAIRFEDLGRLKIFPSLVDLTSILDVVNGTNP